MIRTFILTLAVVLGIGSTRVEGGDLGCLRDVIGDRVLNCAVTCANPCGTARACIRDLTRQIRAESGGACTYLRELSRPSPAATADEAARAALPEELNLLVHASAMRGLWLDLESSMAIARRRCTGGGS